jgi:hypothetical protein
MRPIGPYSRRSVLDKLDRRSGEFLFMQDVKRELIEHVGGNPSATQRALIEQAAWLQLHIRTMDNKAVSGKLTALDSRTYLAWQNTLRRTMQALGPAASPPQDRGPSLRQHLQQRQAAAQTP